MSHEGYKCLFIKGPYNGNATMLPTLELFYRVNAIDMDESPFAITIENTKSNQMASVKLKQGVYELLPKDSYIAQRVTQDPDVRVYYWMGYK